MSISDGLQLIVGLLMIVGVMYLLFAKDKTPESKIKGVDLVKVVDFERHKPAKFNLTPTQCILFIHKVRSFCEYDLEVVYFDSEHEKPVTLCPSHTDNYRLFLSEDSFERCENQHEVWEQFLKAYNKQLENKPIKLQIEKQREYPEDHQTEYRLEDLGETNYKIANAEDDQEEFQN